MFEFAMAHPIATFFITLVVCACIKDVLTTWARAFAVRKRKGRN